jgi:hypothetical protein
VTLLLTFLVARAWGQHAGSDMFHVTAVRIYPTQIVRLGVHPWSTITPQTQEHKISLNNK